MEGNQGAKPYSCMILAWRTSQCRGGMKKDEHNDAIVSVSVTLRVTRMQPPPHENFTGCLTIEFLFSKQEIMQKRVTSSSKRRARGACTGH